MSLNIAIIIPVHNAAATIEPLFGSIFTQSFSISPEKVLVIDSSSTDATLQIANKYGCKTHVIPKEEFNHGSTRQLAINLVDAEYYIFMTQDAELADSEAVNNLIAAFADEKVGCAYGRQLPKKDANPLAAYARNFNYPENSEVRTIADRDRLGIKTCFNSDSFAAYRKSALIQVGGFPLNVEFSEDLYVAAKMLLAGWKVAYQADAKVYHSHNYSVREEFARYRKIGRFHAQNKWILDNFASPEKEGIKYARSEIASCIKKKFYFYAYLSVLHSLAKYVGYKVGLILVTVQSFLKFGCKYV